MVLISLSTTVHSAILAVAKLGTEGWSQLASLGLLPGDSQQHAAQQNADPFVNTGTVSL